MAWEREVLRCSECKLVRKWSRVKPIEQVVSILIGYTVTPVVMTSIEVTTDDYVRAVILQRKKVIQISTIESSRSEVRGHYDDVHPSALNFNGREVLVGQSNSRDKSRWDQGIPDENTRPPRGCSFVIAVANIPPDVEDVPATQARLRHENNVRRVFEDMRMKLMSSGEVNNGVNVESVYL